MIINRIVDFIAYSPVLFVLTIVLIVEIVVCIILFSTKHGKLSKTWK